MSYLTTPDRDGAAAFYGAVFGWELDSFQMGDLDVGMFRLPGYVGGEPSQPVPRDVIATTLPGEEASWSVDFWIDDVERAIAAATEQGGRVLAGPDDVPPFRQAVVADPNGVSASVSQLTAPPQG
jgi:predicted enzyme related to lactoylglutathione lyase